ncbi:hypothetical protein MMC28_006411 [Mycoblastus sanguinarius]|nr:hypothetical protein [Mycoblastus sanguinarius]
MEALPAELLRNICAYVGNERNALKALRLVNRIFADVAALELFHSLLVLQHPDSCTKVNQITRHPRLAAYVKKVEITSFDYLSKFYDLSDWEQDMSTLRMGRLYGGDPDFFAKIAEDYVTRLRGLHETYCYWQEGEETTVKILDHGDRPIPLQLALLPALRSIQVLEPLQLGYGHDISKDNMYCRGTFSQR